MSMVEAGNNLLVGECCTEMLLDVGLQHGVEVLELSVSNEAYDIYLTDRREEQRQLHIFAAGDINRYKQMIAAYLGKHRQVDKKMSGPMLLRTDSLSSPNRHSPTHQTRGCHSRQFESVPS